MWREPPIVIGLAVKADQEGHIHEYQPSWPSQLAERCSRRPRFANVFQYLFADNQVELGRWLGFAQVERWILKALVRPPAVRGSKLAADLDGINLSYGEGVQQGGDVSIHRFAEPLLQCLGVIDADRPLSAQQTRAQR